MLESTSCFLNNYDLQLRFPRNCAAKISISWASHAGAPSFFFLVLNEKDKERLQKFLFSMM